MEKSICERCKKEYYKVEMFQVNSLVRDSKEYICKECLEYVCSVCGKFSSVMPKEINNGDLKICSQCLTNSADIIECTDCGYLYTKDYWYFALRKPSNICIVCGNRLNL